ncbi:amino acid ABC transporter substrate-binding protein [Thermodesulfobacteriota bacterium]
MRWILLIAFFLLNFTLPNNSFSQNEIRIGLTISETGHFSAEIGPFRKLAEAWADDTNKEGGLTVGREPFKIKLFIYDDRSDEATARRMYERLAVVHKVHFMFGPYSSPLTLAASTAAELHSIPFLAICANSPKIYTRGYRWLLCVIDEAPRYTYRYWDMIRSKGNVNSVSFVVEDTIHPQGVFEGARKLAEDAGISDINYYIAPPDMRDFSSILVKLVKDNSDIVFVSSNIPFAIKFISQVQEMQLKAKEFHVIHHGGVFRKALGEGAEYITGQSYWTPGMKGGQQERFIRLLKTSRISVDDYPWTPAYMMAFEVLEATLKKTGTIEASPIIDTMKSMEIETIGGIVSFKDNGAGSINTYPSQIRNGEYNIVGPSEVATGEHIYPRPGYNNIR